MASPVQFPVKAFQPSLTASDLIIRPEEQAQFNALQNSLLADLAPQGAIEIVTFHDLLHAAWSLHRLRRLEVECDLSNEKAYDRITRHQSRVQRAYYRALKELRILQTNRALRSRKLEDPADPDVPAITDINELTKQTHAEVAAEAIKQACKLLDLQSGLFLRDAREDRRPVPPAKDDRALRL